MKILGKRPYNTYFLVEIAVQGQLIVFWENDLIIPVLARKTIKVEVLVHRAITRWETHQMDLRL